jgi:hypothetical protein
MCPYLDTAKTHSGWSNGACLRESGIGWNAMDEAYQPFWRKGGEPLQKLDLRFCFAVVLD